MPKDDRLYFGHMVDAARKVVEKTRGIDRDTFDRDENLRLAVVHLIQVVGEAARRVSAEGRAAHPEIPWRRITGMRHKIVHDYLDVDEDIVWEVATVDLPSLMVHLIRTVPAEPIDS